MERRDFVGVSGSVFALDDDLPRRLDAVSDPVATGSCEACTHAFEGPSAHPLQLDSYDVAHPTLGEPVIFIVPVADDGGVVHDDAAFGAAVA
jgi:hypothetical protein